MGYGYSYKDLRKYCYFSHLSDGALEALSKKMSTVDFPAGSTIISEGEPADSFYLVSEGEVEIRKRTKWGQDARISVVGNGGGFGEMAMLTCSPRCCSVVAKTDVKLFRLLKTDFDEIVRMDGAFSQILQMRVGSYSRFNSMKTLQPFALIEPEKMAALLDSLEEKRFTDDDIIITQGEKGDEYYIIKSGKVAVLKQMEGDEPVHVATLNEGEGFGEEALISDSVRNATVRAIGDTVLYALPKDQFETVMKSSYLHEVSAQEVLNDRSPYRLLDVRLKYEHDEEHIPGSINIPLDELRRRYGELDRSQKYYVYCLVGARSATAAFLLRSQGFNAYSIKGGMLEWTGDVSDTREGVHAPFKPT
jgi:CRP-like cAMP-binding protein